MKTPLNYTLFFILSFCWTRLFAQPDANVLVEKSKKTWVVPIIKYSKVIDNKERVRAYSYDRTDSSITFVTDSSYFVTAVFPAKVVAEFPIEDHFNLMTQFGDYVIIYGNITKSKFKVGDILTAGQVVGKVLKGDSSQYFLDFILMKKDKRIGAINWFRW